MMNRNTLLAAVTVLTLQLTLPAQENQLETTASSTANARIDQPKENVTLIVPADVDLIQFKQLLDNCTDWQEIKIDAPIDDSWLTAIAECNNLQTLHLNSHQTPNNLTIEGFRQIARFCKLTELSIVKLSLPFTDQILELLVNSCPDLQTFSLSNYRDTDISRDGLLLFGKLPKLRNLQITPKFFDHRFIETLITDCPDLENLTLWSIQSQFSAEEVNKLSRLKKLQVIKCEVMPEVSALQIITLAENLPELRSLFLNGSRNVSTAALASLKNTPHLQHLYLGISAQVDDAAVSELVKNCPKLQLILFDTDTDSAITDQGLATLASLNELHSLRLNNAVNITDQGMVLLGESAAKLVVLNLDEATQITDAGLLALANLPNLIYVQLLSSDKITQAGLDKLKELRPNLTVETPINRQSYRYNQKTTLLLPENCDFAKLKTLLADRTDISEIKCESPAITDEWLATIVKQVPNLQEVTLNNYKTGFPLLTATGLQLLGDCAMVNKLWIQAKEIAFDQAVLTNLIRSWPQLEHLFISGETPLTADSVLILGQAQKLKILHISPQAADDRLLFTLAENCSDLERILIWGNERTNKFTTAGLQALTSLSKLTSIQVHADRQVGDEAVIALAENRPLLKELILNNAGQITDQGLLALKDSSLLERVWFDLKSDAGDAGMLALCHNKPHLNQIIFEKGMNNLTDVGFAALANLPNLWMIRMNANNITDAGITAMMEKSQISDFHLRQARNITDAGLLALTKSERLRYVSLGNADQLTAAGEAEFMKIKPDATLISPLTPSHDDIWAAYIAADAVGVPRQQNLRLPKRCDDATFKQLLSRRTDWLAVRSDSIDFKDSWLQELTAFPELRAFSNTYTNPTALTSAGMALFAKFPQLQLLHLCAQTPLLDADFAKIAENCLQLTDIEICDSGEATISDLALTRLSKCPNLSKLKLRAIRPDAVTDLSLQSLSQHNLQLTSLEITGKTAVTDIGLIALSACSKLTVLKLETSADVSDASMAALGKCQLKTLSLAGAANITDAGLEQLGRQPLLTELNLPAATAITDRRAEISAANFPRLRR